jgi:hypothetical protein
MITLKEKSESIKYLKALVVKHQKYELAAWLRDKEKQILEQLNLPINVSYSYTYEGLITYAQYLQMTDLLSEFENKYSSSKDQYVLKEYTLKTTSEIREELYKNCINVIREQKLDDLFGES